MGILISYLILGIIVSAVGNVIMPYIVYALPIIGGIFLILGIFMFTNYSLTFSRILGWIRKKQMKYVQEDSKTSVRAKITSTFLYGLGYGIASLGCNAPIFLAFSLQVSSQDSIIKMIFAYLAFILTVLLLMIGTTIFISISKEAILQKLKASTSVIKKVSGALIIGVGIYLLLEFFIGT